MLLDHNSIDARRIVECEKRKAPGAACCVAHDGACVDLSELGEVIPQCFYKSGEQPSLVLRQNHIIDNVCTICRIPIEPTNEHFAKDIQI